VLAKLGTKAVSLVTTATRGWIQQFCVKEKEKSIASVSIRLNKAIRMDSIWLFDFTACYGRNFGPKGFGYGIGAGTLQMA